ncbi:Cytochrome P450 [Mycena chlorophos]|uniref:Cytochrome P450 n=1 Tax=Mycena chlorophos TaxID=658473 RepID=A0A8H6TAK3_MYCCL|nr:Cytochrome P450 [Mycena chlorophos]
MLSQILLPIIVTVLAYILFHALQILYDNLASPLRHILPSPPIPNYLAGNFKEMADDPGLTRKWREMYGSSFVFHGLLSMNELHTSDLKALSHIMAHPEIYRRSVINRNVLRRVLGEGILVADQDQHKRHRRVLNPAFGPAQIRSITEIFVEKAVQLRDVWASQITQTNGKPVDVLAGLRKMTLDVIGRAGFGYEFNALNPDTGAPPNALNAAFTELFHSPNAKLYTGIRVLQATVPILQILPLPGRQAVISARHRMDTIGRQIVRESKAQLLGSAAEDKANLKTLGGRRDVLSVMLKANLSSEVPAGQKLSEEEVIAQIPTFFAAGHETTSTGTAWALHLLSTHPTVQSRLREELQSVGTDNPTLDELNALPFLDKVVREALRVHAPATFMQRKAVRDDVIPLGKPIVGRDGKVYESLPIRKGQLIYLPIVSVNTSTEIWGPDALEFRPDRWDTIPAAAHDIPGVWGNLFTFLGGPHNCIGFRFALAELKALLFTLVRAFEIGPAVEKDAIGPVTTGTIQRPAVLHGKGAAKGDETGLPLILTPVVQI